MEVCEVWSVTVCVSLRRCWWNYRGADNANNTTLHFLIFSTAESTASVSHAANFNKIIQQNKQMSETHQLSFNAARSSDFYSYKSNLFFENPSSWMITDSPSVSGVWSFPISLWNTNTAACQAEISFGSLKLLPVHGEWLVSWWSGECKPIPKWLLL